MEKLNKITQGAGAEKLASVPDVFSMHVQVYKWLFAYHL